MSIDFLGKDTKKKPIENKKKTSEVKLHLPEESEKPKQKKAKKTVKVPVEKEFKEVNFVAILKKYLLKKRLIFSLIFAIIIIVVLGGSGYYYFFLYEPAAPDVNQPIAVTSPISSPTPTISPIPRPSPSPSPSPTPSPGIRPTPGPLPDTELAPLKGSLVKFAGEEVLYLVEDNGELRKVDQQTVIFDNGKSIDEISSSLIYTIADRFKDIRRGKDVIGQVDWDPRVLTFSELNPFLR
jgi:hypothetical protein